MRTEIDDLLEEIADAIMPLRERVATAGQLERYSWQIWDACRAAGQTLDSEKQCHQVKAILADACGGIQRRLEAALWAQKDAEKQAKEQRRLARKARRETEALAGMLKEAKKHLEITRAKAAGKEGDRCFQKGCALRKGAKNANADPQN